LKNSFPFLSEEKKGFQASGLFMQRTLKKKQKTDCKKTYAFLASAAALPGMVDGGGCRLSYRNQKENEF